MASLVFLLFLLYEASSGSEILVISVEPGQDVTLPCQAGDGTIGAVEWTRSDLVASEYVLYYSDGHYDETYQNSYFKGRVQLVDGELKTGNVSLILKNVSRDDDGTYECRVVPAASRRSKRAIINTELISTIRLQMRGDQNRDNNNGDIKDGDTNRDNNNGDIKDGDTNRDNNKGDIKDGNSTPQHVALAAAAGVVVLVCSTAVGLFLFRKSKRQRDKKPEPAAGEETGGDNLI